ncbi:MAG TPA: site-2 protease family protein [Candidatus Eisenbacteria bacterium]|nr:site-2 protease family protein [Candidatus Eisenbacteria bacterium]
MDFLLTIGISLVVLLFSAILHEVMHGYIADRLGDPTARLMGRLTLNPLKHIDPFMTILLPLLLFFSGSRILFGGAKPVPIDPFNLKDGKKDVALVALAGPLTNLVVAALAAGILHLGALSIPLLEEVLFLIVQINIYLAIFNLLPIPPLDGSKVFALLLPDEVANSYLSIGSIGVFILFALLSFPIGGFYLPNFMQHLYTLISRLLGL